MRKTGPCALAVGNMAGRLVESRALAREIQQYGARQSKNKGELSIIRRRPGQPDTKVTYKITG